MQQAIGLCDDVSLQGYTYCEQHTRECQVLRGIGSLGQSITS